MATNAQKADASAATTTNPNAEKGKPGRKKADPNETPRARHARVQTPRVRSALKAIQRVGDPVALRTFEYDDEDITKIMVTMRKFCDETEKSLQVGKNKTAIKDDGPAFTL